MSEEKQHDRAVRAMTAEDGFRAVTIRSTEMVRRALQTQKVEGDIARAYAELLTGAVLIRETMAPKMRVQTILKRVEGGSMVADSHPGGMTRGLVNWPDQVDLELGPQTHLQIIRELPNGELHQGVVVTTPEHGLSASLTTYMIRSEQVETAIGVGCVLDGDRLEAAGGYIIQHMPGAPLERLAAITGRLETLPPVSELLAETEASPEELLARVMGDLEYDILQEDEVHFGCNCSTDRFLNSLATLGRTELEDLLAEQEPLDITCDYCAEEYRIPTTRLRHLLDAI